MKKYIYSLFALSIILVFSGCDLDDADENGDSEFTGNEETYELQAAEGSNISGVAVFEEMTDGSTLVTLQMNGTDTGVEHPAHIHDNSVAEGGGIAIPLTNVDGSSGISETVISTTSATYEGLLTFDGHVNVHRSEEDLTVVAEGDMGGNALTGESVSYDLNEADGSGISGEVIFEERRNENTMATIQLNGTDENGDHPAHIHYNSVAEGGDIAVPFNNVDGAAGISRTNVSADETADNLTYSALLDFDGHVNVHLSDEDLSVIAEGDIGSNAGAENGGDDGTDNDDGNGNDGGNDDGNGNGNGDDGY